ncbi:hypothetical protein V8B97DRAFT_1856768, partial [Scleroderma yunnanense]
PAPKHHKTTKKKDNLTRGFNLHPSKMVKKLPSSRKSNATIPFRTMINEAWLEAHPGQQVMDGMEWLQGFYSQAKEGGLSENDQAYLDELAEYFADKDFDD